MSNKVVAKFEKVTFEQFKKAFEETGVNNILGDIIINDEDGIRWIYDNIMLPHRGTKRSSGYDFSYPCNLMIPYNTPVTIPTGIRCVFTEDGYDLNMQPRSGLGFKFRLQLDNTIGLIDNDYAEADNEGHIMIKLTCLDHKERSCIIPTNKGYAQGVIREFFLAEEDEVTNQRTGGMGSTDK